VDQKDQERFEDLYRRNVRHLLAYVLTRTTTERAHDVVSSTFLVAWRRLDELPADVLPWLIGVARRVVADQRRSEARQRALGKRLADSAAASQAAVDDEALSFVLRGSIRDALAQMRPEDREILTLVAWHGFNTDQLAVALGSSKALASLRLHRARRKFVRLFEGQEGSSTRFGEQAIRPLREVP
jgi:RNA polymerase sigma factor (sigma-70 family)